MQRDFSTTLRFVDVGNGIFTFASRFPEHAIISTFTRSTGAHGDFIGNDERRVEAHPELTNQLAVFRLIGAHRFQKCFGARLGNRTEVLNDLVAAHPDTVIGNGQCAVVFIKRDAHTQFAIAVVQIRFGQRAKTQFVRRIRGVGDKLTQEDFFIGIQGMDHQVQKLFYF